MHSFELVLIPFDDSPIDRQVAWSAMEENPHVHPERGVPGKLTYYNRATTVHFSITLGDELHSEVDEEDPFGDGLPDGIPDHVDVLSESSTGSRTSRLDEEDSPMTDEDDEQEDDEQEDDEQDQHIDLPPVSVHIPLFRPTFFLAEALGFLETLRSATDLRLAMPASDTGEDTGDHTREGEAEGVDVSASPDLVVRRWQEMHRQAFDDVPDKEQLQIWSIERCASFYDYNRGLEGIQKELATEGLEVLPIQPARHEGSIKTLCVWRCDRPAVIPQTDLVLVRRPRPRGLFRRAKLEEFLVPGETVWKILERFSQSRHEPAPMLIVRSTEEAPGQLQAELEALQGEPTENARRTELVGVVDFELG